jgi:hypothetical protein
MSLSLKAAVKGVNRFYVALLFLLLACCDLDFVGPRMDQILEYESINPNLIRNAGFEAWDTLNSPLHWEIEEIYNYSEMFAATAGSFYGKLALRMERNSMGVHRVFQNVPVEANSIYQLSVYVRGTINNYLSGGVEVFSSAGESLGKHFVAYCDLPEYKRLSIRFITDKTDSVKVALGFPDGMNAMVVFDNVLLKKSQIGDFSDAARKFAHDLKLEEFNINTFDSNIEKISSRLNYLLISGYSNYLKTGQTSYLEESDNEKAEFIRRYGALMTDSYLYESFTRPSILMAEAYCQRTSLVHSKILEHFNIATNQIYWVKDGIGIHQFFEYWNPFSQKWIILDPFYGVKYSNTVDLGSAEVTDVIEKGKFDSRLIRRINVAEFYFIEDEILAGWRNEVMVQRFGDTRYTLP